MLVTLGEAFIYHDTILHHWTVTCSFCELHFNYFESIKCSLQIKKVSIRHKNGDLHKLCMFSWSGLPLVWLPSHLFIYLFNIIWNVGNDSDMWNLAILEETSLQRVDLRVQHYSMAVDNFPAAICFYLSPQTLRYMFTWNQFSTFKQLNTPICSTCAAYGYLQEQIYLRKTVLTNGWCVFSNHFNI